MKQKIRLNQSELKNIITESVKKALNEGFDFSGYGKIEQEYKNYLSAKKNLIAALREQLFKGDKEAGEALHAFVSNGSTWQIESMLGIK